MSRQVVYLPEVSQDFFEAFAYYKALSPKAALGFDEAFGRAEAEIEEGLRTHQRVFREAALEFGGIEQIKEECRDQRRGIWLENVFQDLRYGAKSLMRSPGFTIDPRNLLGLVLKRGLSFIALGVLIGLAAGKPIDFRFPITLLV